MVRRALISALHLVCLLLAMLSAAEPRVNADTIIAWQFQDGHLAYLQRALDTAQKNHVNNIQFSCDIVRSASHAINNPELAREIRQAVLAAHQRDMTAFLWTRELQEIQPGSTVSLEDPAVWNALRERYRKLHEAIPDVD
ncbi:MAG: hypothetical protein ABIH23_17405, partial [bacterium]